LHQSRYRALVLQVPYEEYGNRLTATDARKLLNYFDGLGVRDALRHRYPNFSRTRDADMLRSEHMPFNLFAPLGSRAALAADLVHRMTGVRFSSGPELRLEWGPTPEEKYLGDKTSFDAYFVGVDDHGRRVGIGVEVKYTEQAYALSDSEALRIRDRNSSYWRVTTQSGVFAAAHTDHLGTDEFRQVWRNHLLGLSMLLQGDLDRFITTTIHPVGNRHFIKVLPQYRSYVAPNHSADVIGTTLEDYIGWIPETDELRDWKKYLAERYLLATPAQQGVAPDERRRSPAARSGARR